MEFETLSEIEKEILQEEGLIRKIVYTAKEVLELPEEEFSVESLPLLGQEGFIHKGRIHLLAGYPKVGKTELLFRFAIDLLDAHRVLYISEEDISIIWTRLNLLKEKFVSEEAKERLIIITPSLLTKEEFFEVIKEHKPEIVIVDTLRTIFSSEIEDEKDATMMTSFFNEIIAFLRGNKTTAIFAHHLTKVSHPDNFLKDVAGSSAITGLVDTILLLTNAGENKRKIQVRGRLIREKSFTYKANEETEEFEVVEEVESDATDDLEEIVLGLEKEWDNKFLTTLEVQSLIKKAKGIDISRNKLLKVLNRMYEKNPDKLERGHKTPGKGKTYKWRLIPGEKENDFSELDILY
jgi:predicted ATP-dependent serine protease